MEFLKRSGTKDYLKILKKRRAELMAIEDRLWSWEMDSLAASKWEQAKKNRENIELLIFERI